MNIAHVNNLNTVSLLSSQGFHGVDTSLETSLFEYGLVWKDTGIETLFIYGIFNTVDGNYVTFDRMFIQNDCDVEAEYDWVDFENLMGFVGMEIEDWRALPLPRKIFDLVNYYGSDSIFGTSYWDGFSITI
jgi:hypothetical protein